MKRVVVAFVLFFLRCVCFATADEPRYLHAQMRSEVLTKFLGRPTSIDAYVLLPPSYYRQHERRYPVLYWIQGFGGIGTITKYESSQFETPMRSHREFIVVLLDGMFNDGHQEFADSANNGPWGTALTTEFMPETEAHFRVMNGWRFVAGHSSGGWSALWLQVTYPDLFVSEWSLSPDPVDFRNFTGPDLTRVPPQNFFTDSSGKDYVLDGQPLRRFVVGRGWERHQFESFDAVFSPKGPDGKPEPLFDRKTGLIDPKVAQYWEEHYDIARILRDNWKTLGPKLGGKLHIIVGNQDEYHLDAPVRLLQAELHDLGSDAEIDFADGANHSTVFDWKRSAIDYIINEASSMLPTP